MAKMSITEFRKLTITQAVKALGLTEEEMTEHTYLYYDQDGDLCAIEKPDHTSYPTDEIDGMGYLVAHTEYAWLDPNNSLNKVMSTSEAAAKFGIQQITVIQNIKRGNVPGRKSGNVWLVDGEAARARWGYGQ